MAHVTITVDEAVVRRARTKAAARGTSLSAVISGFLEDYVGQTGADDALRELFEIADHAGAAIGEDGITWTRDDLYDRAKLR